MIMSWMPRGYSIYPCYARPNVVNPMWVHSSYVKSVETVSSCLIFPLQLPPSPYGSLISEWKDLWGHGSNEILKLVRLAWNHLLHRTRGVHWVAILLDQSVASPSMLSLYINQPSSLSFFTFLLKSTIKTHLSSLLDRRDRPAVLPIVVALLCPSCYFDEYFSPSTYKISSFYTLNLHYRHPLQTHQSLRINCRT